MAWPDDPYRTGQQLFRRPGPRLAAFTAELAGPAEGGRRVALAAAVIYLPLHRTQALTVTGQTLTFGFRAAGIGDPAELPALAAMADLDLMQARRHARVLAGYRLAGELAALGSAGDGRTLRGLAAVQRDWAVRGEAPGPAAMFA